MYEDKYGKCMTFVRVSATGIKTKMIYLITIRIKHRNLPNHYVVSFVNESHLNRVTLVMFQQWKNLILSSDKKSLSKKQFMRLKWNK